MLWSQLGCDSRENVKANELNAESKANIYLALHRVQYYDALCRELLPEQSVEFEKWYTDAGMKKFEIYSPRDQSDFMIAYKSPNGDDVTLFVAYFTDEVRHMVEGECVIDYAQLLGMFEDKSAHYYNELASLFEG